MISYSLRIFLSVAERGSITKTANELFISQPAVSKTIKSLEQKLSLKLFHRDKRHGLILTDAGEKILLLARQMEQLEQRMYGREVANSFRADCNNADSVEGTATLPRKISCGDRRN